MKISSIIARNWKAADKACRILAVVLALVGGAQSARAAVYALQIPGTQAWTDTGIDIAAGSLVEITASGMVQYGPLAEQISGPNGVNFDGQVFFPTAVLPNAIIVSLIGKVGGTTVIGTGTPVPEGVFGSGPGFVGTPYSQILPTGGRLFLGFNDQAGYFYDNSGSFSVNISVVPEPSTMALLLGPGALLFLRNTRRKA